MPSQPDPGIQTALSQQQSTEQIVYEQLVSEGFTGLEAAGIEGNLEEESGLNPENMSGDGGLAWGLAQWHPGRRTASMFTGNVSKDLQSQLQHIKDEYQGSPSYYNLGALQAAKSPEEAAAIVDQYYERSSGAARSQRETYASQIYADAQSGNWPQASSSSIEFQAGALAAGAASAPGAGILSTDYATSDSATGFLSSLNTSLNPSYSLDPFKDVSHAIGTATTRGGLALIGILIVLGGVLIIGFAVILPVAEKGLAVAGPGGRVGKVIRMFPDSDDRRAKRAKKNPGPTRKDKPKPKSVTQKELAEESKAKGTSPGEITTNSKGERINSSGEIMF